MAAFWFAASCSHQDSRPDNGGSKYLGKYVGNFYQATRHYKPQDSHFYYTDVLLKIVRNAWNLTCPADRYIQKVCTRLPEIVAYL